MSMRCFGFPIALDRKTCTTIHTLAQLIRAWGSIKSVVYKKLSKEQFEMLQMTYQCLVLHGGALSQWRKRHYYVIALPLEFSIFRQLVFYHRLRDERLRVTLLKNFSSNKALLEWARCSQYIGVEIHALVTSNLAHRIRELASVALRLLVAMIDQISVMRAELPFGFYHYIGTRLIIPIVSAALLSGGEKRKVTSAEHNRKLVARSNANGNAANAKCVKREMSPKPKCARQHDVDWSKTVEQLLRRRPELNDTVLNYLEDGSGAPIDAKNSASLNHRRTYGRLLLRCKSDGTTRCKWESLKSSEVQRWCSGTTQERHLATLLSVDRRYAAVVVSCVELDNGCRAHHYLALGLV